MSRLLHAQIFRTCTNTACVLAWWRRATCFNRGTPPLGGLYPPLASIGFQSMKNYWVFRLPKYTQSSATRPSKLFITVKMHQLIRKLFFKKISGAKYLVPHTGEKLTYPFPVLRPHSLHALQKTGLARKITRRIVIQTNDCNELDSCVTSAFDLLTLGSKNGG